MVEGTVAINCREYSTRLGPSAAIESRSEFGSPLCVVPQLMHVFLLCLYYVMVMDEYDRLRYTCCVSSRFRFLGEKSHIDHNLSIKMTLIILFAT